MTATELEKLLAERDQLRAENEKLREDMQFAMMTGHDLAKEEYRDRITELEEEAERMRDALRRAQDHILGHGADRMKPVIRQINSVLDQKSGGV